MSEVKTVDVSTASGVILPVPVKRKSTGNAIHQAKMQEENMSKIKWATRCITLFSLVLLTGCSSSQATESSAGNIGGFNHVAGQNVNWFSVNGYHATLNGNVCCVMIPDQWRPGLTVHIEWEVDPNPHENIKKKTKGFGYDPAAYAEHKAKYKHYSADVPIPQYEASAGINVHFLPCHQVKVYMGDAGYGAPEYPVKEPLNMKEPATCPK